MMRSLTAVGILAAGLFSGSAALAQDDGCACLAPALNGAPVGQITSIAGQVLSSRADGIQPAVQGSSLTVGSQLLTGPESSAQLAVGSCALAVAPNSEVTIERAGENICVRINEVDVTQTSQIGNVPVPLLMFGAAAVTAGVASAVSGGDDAASP